MTSFHDRRAASSRKTPEYKAQRVTNAILSVLDARIRQFQPLPADLKDNYDLTLVHRAELAQRFEGAQESLYQRIIEALEPERE
jgi:hypothetical protein